MRSDDNESHNAEENSLIYKEKKIFVILPTNTVAHHNTCNNQN
jgi:hypothetical protein